MKIGITVNGDKRQINEGTNVETLVNSLVKKSSGIIVELNETIVNRNNWKAQTVEAGDEIQLISFVGGG